MQRVRHGALAANERAGHGLDRILDSVLAAATTAISAKVTSMVEQSVARWPRAPDDAGMTAATTVTRGNGSCGSESGLTVTAVSPPSIY